MHIKNKKYNKNNMYYYNRDIINNIFFKLYIKVLII